MNNPYQQCPMYETTNFIIRLIKENDAEDLLKCYSDIIARQFFNSDNCTGNFHFNTLEEMQYCVKAWIDCYERQEFIRFTIVEKKSNFAVGTIEMFGMEEVYKVSRGVLRVDILSEYEKETYLSEIFGVCIDKFFDEFTVQKIVTKAIPLAESRINVLLGLGFKPYNVSDKQDYYICSK